MDTIIKPESSDFELLSTNTETKKLFSSKLVISQE